MKKPKTEHASTQPQSVAEAEAVLQKLTAKREELLASREELTAAKKAAAYDSFTDAGGDHLASVVRSVRAVDADIESLDLATHEGRNRVAVAQAIEMAARDEANASAILETCSALEKGGQELGAAAKTFSETSREVSSLIQRLHGYGISTPSAEQFRVFGSAATRTMLAGSLWAKEFPPVPPLERKSFDGIVGAWVQNIRARVRGREKEAA
jgi:hypothetical protein